MRIVSGKYKGKKLALVKGYKIRPTSDKLKAAIFNVLFSIGNADMKNKIVLDLFAGTGALGIEALSRGAKQCWFIDNDADSVSIIKRNLNSLRIEKEALIILKDFKSGASLLREKGVKFDLILIDPPYKNNLTIQAIEIIYEYRVFNNDCVIVSEHSTDEKLPEEIKEFYKITEKFYSDKVLSFYAAKKSEGLIN